MGLRIAIASSAKRDELDNFLEIARIAELVDVTASSDADESKPAPDVFEVVLTINIEGTDVAIGDTPYEQNQLQRPRLQPSTCSAVVFLRDH